RIATALGLGVLGLAGAALGWWAVSTRSGGEWAFERLGAAFPGELHVKALTGSIRSPLEVRGFRYETDRFQISADRVRIVWSLRDLFQHRLDIRSLDADSVRMALLGGDSALTVTDTAGNELPDVDLPLDLMVRRAVIRHLYVTPASADTAFPIDELRLLSAAFRDTLRIGSLSVRSPLADLEVAGRALPR